jgi:hypothetical protein
LKPNPWTPRTDTERSLVEQELDAILASLHFRNSKRCPAFLRYVVTKGLDGKSGQLKERTIGVDVFDRDPDYDTNADPVVRVSAGEVRKRIAQYYHEVARESEIQIALPVGSYAPEFRKRLARSKPAPDRRPEPFPESFDLVQPFLLAERAPDADTSETRQSDAPLKRPLHPPIRVLIGLLLALTSLGAYFIYQEKSANQVNQLWSPLLQAPGPVLVVIGSGSLELKTPEPPETTFYNHMVGPYHHCSVAVAVALARVASDIQKYDHGYAVKEASTTSLEDLRGRSAVLVAGLNNPWTLRLTEPLRFRLVKGPLARVEDTRNPQNTAWTVDFSQPFSSVSADYGIVARYHDTYTNGNVLILAGLGPYGTEAASEFVSSKQYLAQIERLLPAGAREGNFEAVIRTDVVGGQAGPPHLLAAYAF